MIQFKGGRLVALALFTTAAAVSQAGIVLDFSDVCTGDTPHGTAPFATLSITNVGVDTVRFTLTHNAGSAAGQFLTRLELFVNPMPANMAAVLPLDQYVDSVSFSAGNDAGFAYNVAFNLDNAPPSDRMLPGDTMIQDLTGTGLDQSDFTAMAGPHEGVYALLHLQGITGNGEGSSKLCGTVVPEPSSIVALGTAAALLLGLRRRK